MEHTISFETHPAKSITPAMAATKLVRATWSIAFHSVMTFFSGLSESEIVKLGSKFGIVVITPQIGQNPFDI